MRTGRFNSFGGVLLALLAFSWHGFLITSATNDNFAHLTFAQQWLAGDWPVRDFFDHGWGLQYALSAAAQAIGGERLISEAVVVGAAWGISTWLVFQIVRRMSGSSGAAALAAVLLIVSGARGYSYPKSIVYAVAAALWWEYIRTPTTARIVGFGAWAAVAFYWRPDHGIYVAAAAALAAVVAHGPRMAAIARSSLAGAAMLALIAPFLLYVHLTVGLPEYVQTGTVAARFEHTTHGPHQWPLIRFSTGLFTIESADSYAPAIGIRWSPGSSEEDRRRILERYDLTLLPSDDALVVRVRLSERSLPDVPKLINESIVEDTAGIDRSSGTLTSWPARERWKFNHPWLRAQVLPKLDAQTRASEYTVALFYGLPLVLAAAAFWIARRLAGAATAGQIVAFALFAFLVDLAMLRAPFRARAPDAVVLSAIVFGFLVAWMWRAAAASGRVRAACLRVGAVALVWTVTTSVAGAGQFADRLGGLAAQGTSFERARDTWSAIYGELTSSPPLKYYIDRRARFSLRLAAYVRECVPSSERVLVLWFEPEIYYYGSRLMAGRHLAFASTWADLAHEQRMTLEKVERFSPPIVLARRSALEDQARASYPGLVGYVEREYQIAATVADRGEEYLIFARRDRSILRGFGLENWPCFVRESSAWSRVGQGL